MFDYEYYKHSILNLEGFSKEVRGSVVKNPSASAGDAGLIPGLGRSLG